MSFDFPQQPKRRKSGMSGLMMLLIIGAALFFFMQGSASTDPGAGQSDDIVLPGSGGSQSDERDIGADDSYRSDILGSKDSKPMPTGKSSNNGDWSIEDVDAKNGQSKVAVKEPKSTKTKGKDGWSIEEFPANQKADDGFKLKIDSKGEFKTTEKNDWSIEDVDAKNKKTSEGDWSLEEVDKKRDK